MVSAFVGIVTVSRGDVTNITVAADAFIVASGVDNNAGGHVDMTIRRSWGWRGRTPIRPTISPVRRSP